MSLGLLFKDELRGFYKSKIMIVLWVGLPLMTLLMHIIQMDTEGIPISVLSGLLVASIGGLLAAVMLSTTIVNEIEIKAYDLFLIRPVKRYEIILSKFLSVYLCLVIATFLSLGVGLLVDNIFFTIPPDIILQNTLDSISISLSAMAISCAAGILIGILVKSVGLAAILSIYLGQQLSLVSVLPGIFLEAIDPLIFSISIGLIITIVILVVEIIIFNRKAF